MAEYIEREALLDMLKTLIKRIEPIEESRDMFFHDSGVNGAIMGAVLEVQKIPSADVAPVVHGRWIEREDFNFDTYYDCSACGESFCFIEGVPEENFYLYCPNCGARMDGE